MVALLFALLPVMARAEQTKATPPPISQPLVTEAALAVSLASALGISSTTDEVTAESSLGEVGIAPLNGWIADYPVTPDIVGEVRESVAAAAAAGNLSIGRDEALKRFGDVIAGLDLSVRAYAGGESVIEKPLSCETYPNPSMINSAYGSEGPPIVTYYCPPPDYYALYAWVPYPFWWTDFWFPGFFVLKDFDRHVHVRHHFSHFSNHFVGRDRHRTFRIDPVERFRGRSFTGIGVRQSRGTISTGVPQSSRTIFNPPRSGSAPAVRGGVVPSMRGEVPVRGGVDGGGMRGFGGMRGGSGRR